MENQSFKNNNLLLLMARNRDAMMMMKTTPTGITTAADGNEGDAIKYSSAALRRHGRLIELSPLLPLGMVLIILSIIFMLIIFRQWPGLVAGIVAGCLTTISIYYLLLTLKEQSLVLE